VQKDFLQELFGKSTHRMNEGLVCFDPPIEHCLLGDEDFKNAASIVDLVFDGG
jgi:hypothetical protein